MWSNKNWDSAKKKQKMEKLERKQDGSTCKFCSKIPENNCTKCDADICPQHTKYYRDRFNAPFNEPFCPDCRKKSYLRRTIVVCITIAVVLWIVIAQPEFMFPLVE